MNNKGYVKPKFALNSQEGYSTEYDMPVYCKRCKFQWWETRYYGFGSSSDTNAYDFCDKCKTPEDGVV